MMSEDETAKSRAYVLIPERHHKLLSIHVFTRKRVFSYALHKRM